MNTLKSNKGITLTTLAIILVLMSILAGITIYVGIDSINLARISKFNNELKIIQLKVNEMAEYELTQVEQRNYGHDIAAQTETTKFKISTALAGESANRI